MHFCTIRIVLPLQTSIMQIILDPISKYAYIFFIKWSEHKKLNLYTHSDMELIFTCVKMSTLLSSFAARSKPHGSSLPKQWSKLAAKMKRHDLVGGPNKFSSNEHRRHRWAAAEKLDQCLLHLSASRVLIKLMNCSIDAELTEEPLDGVAHAAWVQAEDDHSLLRR